MSTKVAAAESARVELELEGMSCASCAARIEKTLNGVDGVRATVNFATERAAVEYDPSRCELDDLVQAVEGAGYHAHEHVHGAAHEHGDDRLLSARLALAIMLTVPTAVLAMVSAAQFADWEWVALALATPVVLWSGLGFHRAALAGARHARANMDTLISLGTLAAWTWSTVVLAAGLDADVYFE